MPRFGEVFFCVRNNGVIADGNDFFGAGEAYYDASKITVPTLPVGAEWDRDAPPYMAGGVNPAPLLNNQHRVRGSTNRA